MKKADRIVEKSRHYGDDPNVLKFFKIVFGVTIDITTKRWYSMLIRCNNKYYIKYDLWRVEHGKIAEH